uniref:Uncharacterized protein n=1 Tax=Klebsiella pneumoniae TaxID=573 RepID=A0A8B0SYL2_KLEPN|nr:hypothetical protein [Klebsiella pneumoniae]
MTFAITVCFFGGSGVDNREFDIAYWSKIHTRYPLCIYSCSYLSIFHGPSDSLKRWICCQRDYVRCLTGKNESVVWEAGRVNFFPAEVLLLDFINAHHRRLHF